MLSFLPSLLLGGAPRRSQTPRKPLRASADEALADAVAWIVAHGGCYADPERLELYGHAPFALEPFPFPKREYDRLVALQPHFNALVDAVARDAAWLDGTLAPAARRPSGDGVRCALLLVVRDGSRHRRRVPRGYSADGGTPDRSRRRRSSRRGTDGSATPPRLPRGSSRG